MDPRSNKDDPEKKPPSRDLAEFDPAEREFWDSEDEEDEDEIAEAPAQDPLDEEAEPGDKPLPNDLDEVEDLEDLEEEEDENDPDLPEDGEETEEEAGEGEAAAAEGSAGPSSKRRLSRSDVVWMGVLAALLVVIGIYAVSLFFKNVQTSVGPDYVDFPVKGERVVIGGIETFWRKPDPKVDRVSLNAKLIPCATLKLKSGSGSGRLRLFFENDEDEYVGDPVTLSFTDGVFDSTGKDEADLHGTEGFEHEGQYAAYVTAEFRFWHVNVLEGPRTDDQGPEFKKLTRVRISPRRR